MATAAKLRFLPDVLEEHVEELAFLWEQRRVALLSPIYTRRAFLQLEGRIAAHLEGIVVVGSGALPLLESALGSDDPWMAFAGAFALMRVGGERGPQLVAEAFFGSDGERLDALVEALSHSPLGPLERRLAESAGAPAGSIGPVSAAAAQVLAFHGRLNLNAEQFDRLLRNENADVRRRSWRAAAMANPARRPDIYQAGVADPDGKVRGEALLAAAWGRQDWLVEHCRRLSTQLVPDNWEGIWLLAVLGKPIDHPRISPIAHAHALGTSRMRALGALGHPGVVEALLKHIEGKDVATAVGAAKAFLKITGQDIASGNRVQLPPEDGHEPDEFEKEFLAEALAPDPQLARTHWTKVQPAYSKGTRWCRGLDLSAAVSDEVLAQLDQESRFEACLRGKFEGTWKGSPVDLERFPQLH